MKPRPRHKGQSPRSKAHDDQVVTVEALRSVQSVNGATKGLRVEAFMCAVSRMLHDSYISSSLFFFFSLVQGNETYETEYNSHAWAKTTSGIRTIAVECHPGESHTNGASSPPPLFFFGPFFLGGVLFFWSYFIFFLGGEGRDPRGGPSRITAPLPLFFVFLRGRSYRASMSDQKHDIDPIAESVVFAAPSPPTRLSMLVKLGEQDPGSSSRLWGITLSLLKSTLRLHRKARSCQISPVHISVMWALFQRKRKWHATGRVKHYD